MKAKKRMSTAEFYKLLPKKGWKLEEDVLIRRNGVCPVCAVANRLLHKRKFTTDEVEAAKAIGLPRKIAIRIACAADYHSDKHRSKLEEVCGVKA